MSPFLPDRYKEAQELTKVELDGWNASQPHSGFITIDKATDSNTYFVFAPVLSKRTDAPVLLWLQATFTRGLNRIAPRHTEATGTLGTGVMAILGRMSTPGGLWHTGHADCAPALHAGDAHGRRLERVAVAAFAFRRSPRVQAMLKASPCP